MRVGEFLVRGALCLSLAIFASIDTTAQGRSPGQANGKAATEKAVDKAFSAYCAQADSNQWFCVERRRTAAPPLSDALKWEVVNGYCFDEVGVSRPAATVRMELISKALADAAEHKKSLSPFQQFCREALSGVTQPLLFQYDHTSLRWGSEIWGSANRRVKIDPVTGFPTGYLVPKDQIGIVVTRTNPLIYAASRGTPKEENIEQFDAMARLMSLAGGALPAVIQQIALDHDAAVKKAVSALSAASVDFIGPSLTLPPPPTPFEQDSQDVGLAALQIKTAIDPLKDRLERFASLRSDLQLLSQNLEKGPAVFGGTFDTELESPGEWSNSFGLVRGALKAPYFEGCESLFDAFGSVVTLPVDKPNDIHAATLRFRRLRQTQPVGAQPNCALVKYPQELEAVVNGISEMAEAVAINPDAFFGRGKAVEELRRRQTFGRNGHLQNTMALTAMTRGLGARRDAATQILEKEEATRKAAMALASVARRARDAAFRQDHDGLLVSDRIYVEEEVYESSWAKVRTTPLNISLSSPYADQVTPARPKDVATSYRMARQGADRFSVTVGILYTTAASPTYVAADPEPGTNTVVKTATQTPVTGGTTTTEVTQPELKRITMKDEDSRAGQFAMFAGWRILGDERVGLGVQGGVAVSTDKPAFLGGAVFNFSKWLMVGGGMGQFRVKKLGMGANGALQSLDGPVGSTDDIKVENGWIPEGYAVLSVNILGLPLFSSK